MENMLARLLASRTSTNYFDANRPVEKGVIEELVRLATLAPSAYNFQNWKFIAVQSSGAKARLREVSYGQAKVEDASVTFIVCGLLRAHEQLHDAVQPSVDAGILSQADAGALVKQARRSHEHDATLQRDEAMRSASLAAMTLIMGATSMGLATCPLSGFDGSALVKAFDLEAHELPVMLIAVGHAAAGNWPQKLRRPVEHVLHYA